MMGMRLPLVQLQEFTSHLLELVTHTGVICQAQQRIILIDWRGVADAVLKPLCIPMHEFQFLFLSELLDVSVDL